MFLKVSSSQKDSMILFWFYACTSPWASLTPPGGQHRSLAWVHLSLWPCPALQGCVWPQWPPLDPLLLQGCARRAKTLPASPPQPPTPGCCSAAASTASASPRVPGMCKSRSWKMVQNHKCLEDEVAWSNTIAIEEIKLCCKNMIQLNYVQLLMQWQVCSLTSLQELFPCYTSFLGFENKELPLHGRDSHQHIQLPNGQKRAHENQQCWSLVTQKYLHDKNHILSMQAESTAAVN